MSERERIVRGKTGLRAFLVVSLLPVSEINQRFRPGCGRAGGGLQDPAPPVSCASRLEATGRSYWKMNDLNKPAAPPTATTLEIGEEAAAQRIDNFLLKRLRVRRGGRPGERGFASPC